MKISASALALTVAGAMLAATAFAQGTGGSGSSGATTGTSKDMKNTPGSGSTSAPSSSPDPASPGATSKDAKKSGSMKSKDGMKSDSSMKSDSMKSGGSMAGGNAEQVKAVQQALKDKGVNPGPVDGKMGPKTSSALREFQKKEGLKASGRLDAETAAKLGVQAKTSDSSSTATPSASPSTGETGGNKPAATGEKK
ncbi:MAG TPA: peptidoglycan-binding domain-containing protein [Methylomirabilota bacterium]|nr:peptidoglycan-binding domain-containing protein [Methylomirabilota bacterium]